MEAITREEKIISGENLTPITRKEMFLAKASGQNIQTPTPITREEYFLSQITGGSGGSGFVVCNNEIPSQNNVVFDMEGLKIRYPIATRVGGNAFNGCKNLVAIDLPKVTSIEANAFKGCKSLKTLILRTTETVCVIDLTAFDESGFLQNLQGTNNGYIYVPAVMYEYYRAGYEQPLASVLGAGAFDRIVRKIEDYPDICNGTSTSGASAYTVSSIDELPSDAVEGSMAIVPSDSVVGTWYFNKEIPREGMPTHGYDASSDGYFYEVVTLDTYNTAYAYLSLDDYARYGVTEGIAISLAYEKSKSTICTLYDTTDYDGNDYGWQGEECRTLTIFRCNDEIIAYWIKTHATRLSGGKSLYTRENGEWVYKCEVV